MFLAELTGPDAASLGIALAIGLLLGLQRERTQASHGEPSIAGARTFPLVALLGAMSVLATGGEASWLTAIAFAGVAALTTVGYLRASKDGANLGLTSEASLLLVFVLGAAAAAGHREAAAIVGTAALVLIGLKSHLHGLAGKLTDQDEIAFLKFVAVALLVVPFLPDHDVGPYGAVNPRDIGNMAVLVAGVSFVAYVAVKTVGVGRGILVTGLLGGLVSSTATTAALARRSRESPELSARLAAGATAASAVLYPRIVALVAVVSPAFALRVALVLAPMALVTVVTSLGGFFSQRHTTTNVPLKNPFELSPAIWFALLYGLVVLLVRIAREWFGTAGLYVVGALAGTTDMDAISLTTARLYGASGDGTALERTILIAAAANTLVKTAIAKMGGAPEYGRRVAFALVGSAVAGVATVFLV